MLGITAISTTFADWFTRVGQPAAKTTTVQRTRSFDQAVRHSMQRFAAAHPEWAAARFDEHFLAHGAASLLAAYRQPNSVGTQLATGAELALAWDKQLGAAAAATRWRRIAELSPLATQFLKMLEDELGAAVQRPTQSLTLDIAYEPGSVPVVTFRLAGVLDGRTYERLLTWAQEAYDRGDCRLVLDMSGVDRIATSGLYALHAIAALFRGEGMPAADGWGALRQLAQEGQRGIPHGSVAIVNPQPAVAKVMLAGGIDKVMPVQR